MSASESSSTGALSNAMGDILAGSSWVRRMFEAGAKLREKIGAENVYDFSLGNPSAEPPAKFMDALREAAADNTPGLHKYMTNAGFPETRSAVARMVASVETGVADTLNESHVVMTVGAAGALNCVCKALLDRGDEVVVLKPFFGEYKFYVENHGGKVVFAGTTPDFDLDVDAVMAAVTDRTRFVLICSPNNPTGRVYDPARVSALGKALAARTAANPGLKPVYLINDAVYGRLVYDESRRRSVLFSSYQHTIVAGSFSKDMSLAGERIGYLALNPADPHAGELHGALATVNRILGFVNSPAVVQRAIAKSADATVELSFYEEKVSALHAVLLAAGIECVKPEGAFFLFPRVPGGLDDLEFVQALQESGILAVPGRGFGTEGHFRLSCGVTMDTINRSAPFFKKVADAFRAKHGL